MSYPGVRFWCELPWSPKYFCRYFHQTCTSPSHQRVKYGLQEHSFYSMGKYTWSRACNPSRYFFWFSSTVLILHLYTFLYSITTFHFLPHKLTHLLSPLLKKHISIKYTVAHMPYPILAVILLILVQWWRKLCWTPG